MQLRQNIPLAGYTTLGIGGPAAWFVEATSELDVQQACQFAREQGLPLFVLGGGSNVLVADTGFPGLVLHIALRGIQPRKDGQLDVAAGEPWDPLVQYTVDHDLAGMECLAGIPGTTGGTPVQNVGAYGQEVSETIVSVHAWDTEAETFLDLSNEQCGFAYRTSLLNTSARGRYVVTAVRFRLRPGGAPRLGYADLQRRFAGKPTPMLAEVAAAVREIRRAKGMVVDPADADTRSAGSFFRNPVVASSLLPRIGIAAATAPEEIPHWPAGKGTVKLPAAWLLERAGFVRGYRLGGAAISTRHTLALPNRNGASAAEIAALRDSIIAGVESRFGITLEQEPVNVG